MAIVGDANVFERGELGAAGAGRDFALAGEHAELVVDQGDHGPWRVARIGAEFTGEDEVARIVDRRAVVDVDDFFVGPRDQRDVFGDDALEDDLGRREGGEECQHRECEGTNRRAGSHQSVSSVYPSLVGRVAALPPRA